MKRAERYAQVKALRDDGLLLREIAEQTGLAITTVGDLLKDPTGEKARERKRRYERACVDCGRTINPHGIRRETERCLTCNGARERKLTRRWILESFAEWNRLFGAPPAATDWNPAQCRAKGMAWKARRAERTGRSWPPSSTVQTHFGSWNAGLAAAGFAPLTPSEYPMGRHGVALRDEELAA